MPKWVSVNTIEKYRPKILEFCEDHPFPGDYTNSDRTNYQWFADCAKFVGISHDHLRKVIMAMDWITPRKVYGRSLKQENIPDLLVANAGNVYLVLEKRGNKFVSVYDAGSNANVAAAFVAGVEYGRKAVARDTRDVPSGE